MNILGNIFKNPSLPAVAIVYAVSNSNDEMFSSMIGWWLRTVICGPGIRPIASCPICQLVQDTLERV